jgi:hypothetical protein
MAISLTDLAQQQRMRGLFQEAESTLTEAITQNPHDAEAYSLRGALYAVMCLPGRAGEDFKQVRELRPDLKDYVEDWLVKLGRREDEHLTGRIAQALTQFAYKTCGPNRLGNERPTWQVYSDKVSVFTEKGFVKSSVRAIFDFCPTPQMLLTVDPQLGEYEVKVLLGITVKNLKSPHAPFAELETFTADGWDDLKQKLLGMLSDGILERDDRFLRYTKFTGYVKSINPMSVITY